MPKALHHKVAGPAVGATDISGYGRDYHKKISLLKSTEKSRSMVRSLSFGDIYSSINKCVCVCVFHLLFDFNSLTLTIPAKVHSFCTFSMCLLFRKVPKVYL